MNNFISTFDELSKLYDTDAQLNESVETLTEGKILDSLKKVATRLGADAATIVRAFAELLPGDKAYEAAVNAENKAVLKALQSGNERVLNTLTIDDIEELKKDIEDYTKSKQATNESCEKSLEEDTDDVIEIEDDEITEEEPVQEEPIADEPKRVVLECSKCGALVIKDEADIVVVEDSDLVNVEDACEYCEEAAGYKTIGTVIPFESETDAVDEDDAVEESVENKEELEEILDFDVPINITANDNNVAIGGIN
jgi:rubrerythrin